MTRTLAIFFATASLLAVLAAPALAGPLWTADWVPLKPNIVTEHGNQLLFSDVTLHNGDGTESGVLASTVTIAQPFVGESDFFNHQNYSLQLTLKDAASGETAVMTFSGDLHGTVNADGSSITNTFDVANTVHDADLGDNHYTVTIGPYVPNGLGTAVGSIYATIAVAVPDPEPVPEPREAPEPTTLALAGLGAALSGLGWYRKRQAA